MRMSRLAVLAAVVFAPFAAAAASTAQAQVCGDADGNGQVSVTDGVNVLRAVAGLPSACTVAACDTNGDRIIAVTDGVQVLRAVAALSSNCSAVDDITELTTSVFGGIRKVVEGGFAVDQRTEGSPSDSFPPAPTLGELTKVKVETTAIAISGRSVPYDLEVPAGATTSLIVAGARPDGSLLPGFFEVPLPGEVGPIIAGVLFAPQVTSRVTQLAFAARINGQVGAYAFIPAPVRERFSTGLESIEREAPPALAELGLLNLTISPDGRHIYARLDAFPPRSALFATDPSTGLLRFDSIVEVGGGAVISPDGRFMYGARLNGISIFARDANDGSVQLQGSIDIGGEGFLAGGGLLISSDGSSLYVPEVGPNIIHTLRRNSNDGTLAAIGGLALGGSVLLGDAISPDGRNVYVGQGRDGESNRTAILILARNEIDGSLVLRGEVPTAGIGLLRIAPNGSRLAQTDFANQAVEIFDRDGGTGDLAPRGLVRQGEDGVDGLDGVSSCVFTPQGDRLYTVAGTPFGGAVGAFSIAGERITFLGADFAGASDIRPFDSVAGIVLSNDGSTAYVSAKKQDGSSSSEGSVIAFRLQK